MWDLEADVWRRFWKQDQERWERNHRQLQFVSWLIVVMAWMAAGAVVVAAALGG